MNAQDGEGKTVLHWITEGDNVEMLQILLEEGADVSIRDTKNQSVIEIAVRNNQLEMTKILLRRKDIDINLESNCGFTLLHNSAEIGSLELTQYLVLEGANIYEENMNGCLPIHTAAVKGHKDIVEFYLDKNVDINDVGYQYFTPLHWAALEGKINVCELLIERGADINAFTENGLTPLHLALINGHEDTFRILLHNGAYYNDLINPQDLISSSKCDYLLRIIKNLAIAVKNNELSKVEFQLKEADHPKFSIANASSVEYKTPLQHASMNGHEEIVDILLKYKANPNISDERKLMPLHYAAKFGYLKIVKTLLMNGAIYNPLCQFQKSPTEFATDTTIVSLLDFANMVFTKVKMKDETVLKDLKKVKNEEWSKLMLRARDRKGKTLVEVAILNGVLWTEQMKELFQVDIIHHLTNASTCQHDLVGLKIVLDRRIELFGPENPATLDILELSARVLINLQRDEEALELLRKIYRIRKLIFDKHHKETLITKSLLAFIYLRQSRNTEAFELFKEVLKYKYLFEKHNLDILYSEMNMSLILAEKGNFHKALKISFAVFDKIGNKYELYKINLDVLDNVAMVLKAQRRYSEAKEIFETVYNFRKKILLPNDHELLKSQSYIAEMLYKLRKYDESLRMLKDTQKILKYHYSSYTISVLSNELEIAKVLLSQGMFIKSLKKLLVIESKTEKWGADHCLVKMNKSCIESIIFHLKLIECEWIVEKIRSEFKLAQAQNQLKNIEMDFNSSDEAGQTALHIAIYNGEREKVNTLLERKTDIFLTTKEGRTVLHIAAAKGYYDITETLINYALVTNRPSAKHLINARDNSLTTALHLVSNVSTAKCLLKHGAIYNIKNVAGQTPFDIARDEKVLSLLQTVDGFFNAVRNGGHGVVQKLDELEPEDALVAVNARNCQDHCLLQLAIVNQQKDLAQEIGNWLKNNASKQ